MSISYKKRTLSIITIIICSTILTGCFFLNNKVTTSSWTISNTTEDIISDNGTLLSSKDKLSQLKKRYNFRSIIKKGDYFFTKDQPEVALAFYLKSYRSLPTDYNLEKKIANTYFELKNFPGAYVFYKKALLQNNSKELHKPYFYALLSTFNKTLIDTELKSSFAKQKTGFDYALLWRNCYNGADACSNYVTGYTGKSPEILALKDLLISAKNITPDPSYQKALLVGQFVKEQFFGPAAFLGEEILRSQPNYAPILKITGIAYYELGDYRKAKLYLLRYYNIDPKDTQSSYLLGMLHYFLKDYVSSNLYFNTTVLNGFTPKIEVERRLIYNYYILGDKKSMFKIFRYLLAEKEAGLDDYCVAIFSSLEFHETSKALLWTNKWLTLFPDNDTLIAFRGWIYRLQKENTKATTDLQSSLKKNPRNIVALYNMWLIEYQEGKKDDAKKLFSNVINIDKESYFGVESQKMIKTIEQSPENLTPTE